MEETQLLEIAEAIMTQPTAPFHEGAVRMEIERRLAELPHVRLERDDFGNLIATYERGGVAPRFAFVAHMDHPAYVGDTFLGGVPQIYRDKNPPTQSFGPFSMWDLPAFGVREGLLYSRACDDLVGCAAIVAMMEELEESDADAGCVALFTRAEEVGLIGSVLLARSGRLDKALTIVSLETSSERGGPVRMGDGVIVRAGDRTSIFDSDGTAQIIKLAQIGDIPYQRALMQGGTCEASAFQAYGYRSVALCVALGNYHNCGPDNSIASEYVSIDDALGMARLCAAAAAAGDLPDPRAALREMLETKSEEYRPLFGS